MKRYYSPGKLLLSGEYAVLDGALSLALPTRYGQSLVAEGHRKPGVEWKSLDDKGSVWFEGKFSLNPSRHVTYLGDIKYTDIGDRLALILEKALQQNPDLGNSFFRQKVTSHLEFPRNWGLGSSSTLINNIAQWMDIDAFELLFDTLGGSGYDIACAQHQTPILYRLNKGIPEVEAIRYEPAFKEELCFVYLGHKQKSSDAIRHYRTAVKTDDLFIQTLSDLTGEIRLCNDLKEFERLIDTHEALLSKVLKLPRVKSHFEDYPGKLKSLGAWGGDFILATRADAARAYFTKKGLTTVIPYSKMVL